ncbi:MAG: hypothetical protein ABI587_11105 [Gemmatimonadales bacterium]
MAAAEDPAPSFDLDRLAHAAKRLLAGVSIEEVATETGLDPKELVRLREQLVRVGVARSAQDSTGLERTPTLLAWLGRMLGYRK